MKYVLIMCLLTAHFAASGIDFNSSDIRSLGLGQIRAPLSSHQNPASLSLSPTHRVSLQYENRFLLKELSTGSLCYQQVIGGIGFGALFGYSGNADFYEYQCGISVSKLLNPHFSLGVKCYFQQMGWSDNQNNTGFFSADIGLQYTPVDNFFLGVLFRNPFRAGYKSDDWIYKQPFSFSAGMQYDFSPTCSVFLETEKSTDYPMLFKTAVEYKPVPGFCFRTGLKTLPLSPTFGIGYQHGFFGADLAGDYHPQLGFSPALGIHLIF